jgi:hypothetical protein
MLDGKKKENEEEEIHTPNFLIILGRPIVTNNSKILSQLL